MKMNLQDLWAGLGIMFVCLGIGGCMALQNGYIKIDYKSPAPIIQPVFQGSYTNYFESIK